MYTEMKIFVRTLDRVACPPIDIVREEGERGIRIAHGVVQKVTSAG